MKRLILAILMLTTRCFAQIRYEDLKLMDAKDPARPALEAWKRKVLEGYEKSFVEVSFNSVWYEMPFASLKRLFPNYRFFAIEWNERPVKGKEKEVIGLGGGEYTLVCSKDHKVVYEIYHYGNYELYGKLLADRKAVIRS